MNCTHHCPGSCSTLAFGFPAHTCFVSACPTDPVLSSSSHWRGVVVTLWWGSVWWFWFAPPFAARTIAMWAGGLGGTLARHQTFLLLFWTGCQVFFPLCFLLGSWARIACPGGYRPSNLLAKMCSVSSNLHVLCAGIDPKHRQLLSSHAPTLCLHCHLPEVLSIFIHWPCASYSWIFSMHLQYHESLCY